MAAKAAPTGSQGYIEPSLCDPKTPIANKMQAKMSAILSLVFTVYAEPTVDYKFPVVPLNGPAQVVR
jgi:hypothetical protein